MRVVWKKILEDHQLIRAGHVKHLLLLHGEHLHTIIIIIIISLFYVLFISWLFESVFELVSIWISQYLNWSEDKGLGRVSLVFSFPRF